MSPPARLRTLTAEEQSLDIANANTPSSASHPSFMAKTFTSNRPTSVSLGGAAEAVREAILLCACLHRPGSGVSQPNSSEEQCTTSSSSRRLYVATDLIPNRPGSALLRGIMEGSSRRREKRDFGVRTGPSAGAS
jgi:hypothetical protein